MISYFEALSNIEDNFSKFNNWIAYLNNEIKHLSHQKDKISVFKVVFNKECDEMVYECFKKMERYTSKAEPQHKDDFVYCNIHNIDSLFVKIKSHEKAFIPSTVKKEFKSINIDWNEKDFSLLKEASNVAISILQEHFENYLPEYLERSSIYLSPENKNNLLKYSKNDFIKNIVVFVLNGNPTNVVKESLKTVYLKDAKVPAKKDEAHTNSFMLNYMYNDKMEKVQKREREEIINKKFLHMLHLLKKNGFIDANTTEAQLNGIINTSSVKKKIIWKGSNGSLYYFVMLIGPKLNSGYSKWISTRNCFLNNKGKEVTIKIGSNTKPKDYKSSKEVLESLTKEFICNSRDLI